MKILFLIAILIGSVNAEAGEGTGLGVTIGSPNGATGRSWIDNEHSIDYGFGWGLTESKKFQLYGDFLWDRSEVFELNSEKFDAFFGAGLGLRTNAGKNENELSMGPRFPAGVSYTFAQPKLELFALAAVNFGLIPSTEVYVDVNLGARFYFF